MYTLRLKSRGDLVSSWPVHPDTHIPGLAAAIDQAVTFLQRFGPVVVWIDNGNVSHLIGSWPCSGKASFLA